MSTRTPIASTLSAAEPDISARIDTLRQQAAEGAARTDARLLAAAVAALNVRLLTIRARLCLANMRRAVDALAGLLGEPAP